MDKFTPLIPKLVAATERSRARCSLSGKTFGDDRKDGLTSSNATTDSKAARFHQTGKLRAILEGSFSPWPSLTRWVIYGTPSDEVQEGETRTSNPIL